MHGGLRAVAATLSRVFRLPQPAGGTAVVERAEGTATGEGGAVPSAALRMASRYPKLLPAEPGMQPFLAWLDGMGVALPRDEIESMYRDVCDLAGWQEPPTLADGAVPIPAAKTSIISVRPIVGAEEQARRFLAWIDRKHRHGNYTSAEIDKLFLEYAAELGIDPPSGQLIRTALRNLGVRSRQRTTGTRPGNRRERRMKTVVWEMPAPDAERLAA